MNSSSVQFSILYDNDTLQNGLIPDWGFSCLLSLQETFILFDTGGDSHVLLGNMRRMGIDPGKIDGVVLSHAHGDHVGGLSGLLGHRPPIKVYMPESFPRGFKADVSLLGGKVINTGESVRIHPGVYTTGELGGSIPEQSLVLETDEGLVVITGCAHPGIVETVEHVRGLFNGKVYLIIGGFHLMGQSDDQIKSILRKLEELEVERIGPCHCTGGRAKELIASHYGENNIECGAGLSLGLPGLRA